MPLHLLVKWEVVSPNSRWGQWESISNISSIPLLSQMWGGVMFFLHFMLFQTFLEKQNSGYKKYIYNLIGFFSSDFCGGGWC